MKKLELVGIVVAVAAVFSAVVNGGADVVAAIAFSPVMLLAALQYAPSKDAWKIVRDIAIMASLLGSALTMIVFVLLAGLLREKLPSDPLMLAGYATTAFCGLVTIACLSWGNNEIMRTGVYKYARVPNRA